jgi:DNA mismatch endonuclease (patch repair protein)
MDVHDKKTRSYNMSRIKSGNTKPELIVRSTCHRIGLRYRLLEKKLPGKPDLVFPKHRTVLFVHGCYWHSHDCKYGKVQPKSNAEFWKSKRAATEERDRRNISLLESMGWRVLVYWECETKDRVSLSKRIRQDFRLD